MNQLNDISLVAQVVVFRNTKAFDQLVKKYQSRSGGSSWIWLAENSELSDDWHKTRLSKRIQNICFFQKFCPVSPRGCIELLTIYFYDYIRSRKETADLDAREIDAANSAEQENIGQKDGYLPDRSRRLKK